MKRRSRFDKKRHGWLAVITLFVWVLIGLMIMFVDPEGLRNIIFENSYLLPGLLMYLGLFLLLSILTLSAKRAWLWSSVLIVALYLRLWGLDSYVNLLLLLGVAGSVEIYSL